jgi:predicted MFS family arabinose efflux permease
VGLSLNLTTLIPLDRGLSVAQTLTLYSVSGFVVFALELPTGGLADGIGRRPLLVAAAGFQLVGALLFVTARSFAGFAAACLVMGVFRALDSGPLEAWFVDAHQAGRPGTGVAVPLARASTILGAAIATGALAAGGLIVWHPLRALSALTLPYLLFIGFAGVYLAAVALLVKEPSRLAGGRAGDSVARRAAASFRAVPATVAGALRLARRSRVLASLLGVEAFWAAAMVVFEVFQPIRLAEFLGGEAAAGAVMGPVACAGWGAFALGAALAGSASKRLGPALTGILARLLNGLGAVAMGLAGGPTALIGAYLFTYAMHGAGGPSYNTLLHGQASPANRTVVLSLASMAGFASYAAAAPLLGRLAAAAGTPAAMVAAGAFSCLGVACFIPAWRQERAAGQAAG